jgi:acetolactate synthase I/III small subunit
MKGIYTLCVFTENSPGVLQRITVLFTKRKLNIESLTVSETEQKGISRFTIVVDTDRELVEKVAKQIHRIIEVFDVVVCENSELVFKEIAFYQVRAETTDDKRAVDEIAKRFGANLAYSNGRSVMVEKTGSEDEVKTLFVALEPHGILQFVRSGRIALLKEERKESLAYPGLTGERDEALEQQSLA